MKTDYCRDPWDATTTDYLDRRAIRIHDGEPLSDWPYWVPFHEIIWPPDYHRDNLWKCFDKTIAKRRTDKHLSSKSEGTWLVRDIRWQDMEDLVPKPLHETWLCSCSTWKQVRHAIEDTCVMQPCGSESNILSRGRFPG